MIVAAYIADFLAGIGIDRVFGYDGSAMLKIADEMVLTGRITYTQGFHEQGIAFAADAYARAGNRMSVAIATSGPGAVNMLGGIADAYYDSIPMLYITGQDYSAALLGNPGVRLNGFQDLNIVSMATPITKYAVMIKRVEDVSYELEKAVYIAQEGRMGPVLVDIPMDVQFTEMPEVIRHFPLPEQAQHRGYDTEVGLLLRELFLAKRPVILLGGGVRLAGAVDEVTEFVRGTGIPVVTTLNGIDTYADAVGFSGLYGDVAANLAVYNADVLFAFGVRFGQRQVGKKPDEYTKARVVHVDIDALELGRVLAETLPVQADLKSFLAEVNDNLPDKLYEKHSVWSAQIKKWKKLYQDAGAVNHDGLDPVLFVREISGYTQKNTIYTNDVGQNQMWVNQGIKLLDGQRLLASSGYGSMGFSLPAAVGAALWNQGNPVVAFTGDGGFQMNMQELQFIAMHRLNIKCIVFNNNTLGMMREVQRLYYNDHFVGSNEQEFQCVDLEKLATVYNMRYICVSGMQQCEVVRCEFMQEGPCLIDCRVQYESYLMNRYEWQDVFEKSRAEIDEGTRDADDVR